MRGFFFFWCSLIVWSQAKWNVSVIDRHKHDEIVKNTTWMEPAGWLHRFLTQQPSSSSSRHFPAHLSEVRFRHDDGVRV